MTAVPVSDVAAHRRAILVLLCGFSALAIAFGIRATFGLFLNPISADLGWSIGTLSFAFALQNLLWGVAQPFAGALADSKGATKVVAGGLLLYAAGLVMMAWSDSLLLFDASTGLIIGMAQSAVGFPVILGAIGRATPPERRSLYLGIATAGGSFGQFIFAPIGQQLISSLGWIDALIAMAAIAVAATLLAVGLRGEREAKAEFVDRLRTSADDGMRIREALAVAARHRGFLLLNAGFFVCGFQLAFITVHLPAFATLCGLAAAAGSTGIALIGVANIFGTVAAGQIGSIYRPKFPLSLIYFGRSLGAVAMVTIPVTEAVLYGFSIVMGLLWLSTVPLTSSVVSQIFGPKHVGMLFGIVFLSHQLGSFAGVWLAGYLFDVFGSYDLVWWLSAALGLFAALVHLPIDDRRIALRVASA